MLRWWVVLLLLLGPRLALAAPQLAGAADADALFLAAAEAARVQGDHEGMMAALRGWATLRHRRELPEGLEKEAAEAVAFAEREGLLQVFASRLPDRVRVGLRDPAGVVSRLDVFARDPGGEKQRLVRVEGEPEARLEYRLTEALGAKELVVEAVLETGAGDLVLRRAHVLPPATDLPAAPAPEALPNRLRAELPPGPAPVDAPAAPSPAITWWLITGGVVAAALVGGAIWQETRF